MKTIQNMFEHVHWANQQILQTLENLDTENKRAIRLFAHVLFAEQIWINRIQGKDTSQLPIWGDVDLETCNKLMEENRENISTLLSSLEQTTLDTAVTYKNSKGKEFQKSIRDVLTHLALHGQYHRGQINARLREDGAEPVNVDYITFVR